MVGVHGKQSNPYHGRRKGKETRETETERERERERKRERDYAC
jgi:hypothetical protein